MFPYLLESQSLRLLLSLMEMSCVRIEADEADEEDRVKLNTSEVLVSLECRGSSVILL